ncbi:amidase [Dactylosporangium fulvum]|uniref:Amidase n=1 Tax=Dactylosporangium fulvum TaxID=53359 RepID=A0ABY5W9Q8_9ACTN|nr:amidase [Dactylosporangium fulvum]UWP86798.1 amidase [Dactylosporangium fulvum]
MVTALAERAQSVNPIINALVTTDFDRALQEARALERAATDSEHRPLLGVPISIKDLTDTAGMRTTYGSHRFSDHVPAEDAEVVRRVRKAGAIVFGKTNTPEFGAGINTVNDLFGATRNPWNTDRSAGGSSGGAAAAVAAGLGPLAEATDHGCSVRLPASFNGLVGLRTTPGRIPQWPNDWVFDSYAVTGPLARTVADCELLFQVMSGPDSRVPISDMEPYTPAAPDSGLSVRGWRIAWSADLGIAAVDPEVRTICGEAVKVLDEAGAIIDEHAPDFTDVRRIIDPLRAVRQVAQAERTTGTAGGIENTFVEAYLRKAKEYSAYDVGRAEAFRSTLWQRLDHFFATYRLLVTVTTQVPAFPVERLFPDTIDGREIHDVIEACLSCYAITVTGLPAISIPVGFTSGGLPVGLQVIGRPRDEATLFAVARLLETIRPWSSARPRLTSGEGRSDGR